MLEQDELPRDFPYLAIVFFDSAWPHLFFNQFRCNGPYQDAHRYQYAVGLAAAAQDVYCLEDIGKKLILICTHGENVFLPREEWDKNGIQRENYRLFDKAI